MTELSTVTFWPELRALKARLGAKSIQEVLLALMSVLSQSLLTLVRRHLVPLMLLSVWHNFRYLQLVLFCVIILFRTAKVQLFSERQKVLCHFVEKKLAFCVFHAEKAVLLHHDFIIWHAIRAMV